MAADGSVEVDQLEFGPAFWEARYQAGLVPWDLGEAPPVLLELVQQLERPLRVLCPGAGRGHDAIAWAAAGHDVVAVDIAPTAVSEAATLAADRGVGLELLQADVFDLPRDLVGSFGVVWEQTCLCSLDPARRTEYVDVVWRMLRPRGRLWALLWNHGEGGGPPWDLSPALARGIFSPRFEILEVERVTTGTRQDEFLLQAVRR
jgi:SAM-dependent methyltransferase